MTFLFALALPGLLAFRYGATRRSISADIPSSRRIWTSATEEFVLDEGRPPDAWSESLTTERVVIPSEARNLSSPFFCSRVFVFSRSLVALLSPLYPFRNSPLSLTTGPRYSISCYDISPGPGPLVVSCLSAGLTRDLSVSRRTLMIQPYRPFDRSLLLAVSVMALFVAGCNKKPPAAAAPAYTPPPAAVKPTASLSADRTSINKGESVKLSWTTTDATNVSISPEVGAVTPQGSTTVSPLDSTTYTLTVSSGGGNADSSVRISVSAPAPPPPAKTGSFDELFTREVRDAYFDYDSAEIRPDARTALQKTAEFLRGYPNAHVTIEGHCDERGSTEYNLALGQRRANAVKEYLVSLGLNGASLTTTSWGKEKPFCSEGNEACWRQNRRGHFTPNK